MSEYIEKERILKEAREKELITHKICSIRLFSDFSTDTLEVRRQLTDTVKVLKERKKSTKNAVQGKTVFKSEGEIMAISDKQKLKQFISTRSTMQEILKRVLQVT